MSVLAIVAGRHKGWPLTLSLLCMPAAADAALTISSKPTRDVTCSNGVCTATARKAILNATDLAGMLAASDVVVRSGRRARDIEVIAPFSWASSTRLTLDAVQSIVVERPLTVAGPGALTLTTNDGGSGAKLTFTESGHVTLWDLSSDLIINTASYTLVGDLTTLASDVSADASGNYALAKNYNAKADGTYAASVIPFFGGTFEGLGNRISNLTISDPIEGDHVGLFQSTSGTIRDLRLSDVNIVATLHRTGIVGVLAAQNEGSLVDVAVQGSITTDRTWSRFDPSMVGGMVGENRGSIVDSNARVQLSTRDRAIIGGLIGYNENGPIENSHAAGDVSIGSDTYAGGLIGENRYGAIDRCSASGRVTAGDRSDAGGLIGLNSFATVTQSFATGSVAGSEAGGLIGEHGGNYPGISNSYATGAVAGGDSGGLLGFSSGSVVSSYSTGAPSGNRYVGGLVGYDVSMVIENTYWDTTTSGIADLSQGAGNIKNDQGIAGLTTEQLQSGLPSGFDPSIWAEDPSINNGLPYLIANPPK